MSKCRDPNLGKLLHAYELNALSEEEVERFEIHLLECEHCFSQLNDFEQAAYLLSSDEEIKELVGREAQEQYSQSEPFLSRLWKRIWPETPLVFRPALAYFLIILLIIPAYFGLKGLREGEIESPQIIVLTPDLSTTEDHFRIDLQRRGLLRFRFPDAVEGPSYRLTIEDSDGRVIFEDNQFREFDEYGWGYLSFPQDKMKPGHYRLLISAPRGDDSTKGLEYWFKIE